MPTNKQIEAMTEAERAAWRDGMSEDERLVAWTPIGYRSQMVMVSYIKYALVTIEMPIGERLQMLETINGFVDLYFPEAALVAIEPACDTAVAMIHECLKVDEGNPRLGKGLDLLASWEVFEHLRRLNPTLLTAIKVSGGPARHAAAA